MKLSKYVYSAFYKNKVLLYNSYNDMIVELDLIDLLKRSTKTFLFENGFYNNNDEKKLKDFLNRNINNKSEELSLTISFTENCNLKCKYCSQNNVKNFKYISTDIIDDIIKYASICINNYKYKRLAIHLFGGEPLLAKKSIFELKSKLDKLNVPVLYFMDTNATLLDEEFIKHFENITITVTLSSKFDHDYYRTYKNNNGTYHDIITKLQDIKKYADSNHRLIIRFNANHNNIKSFPEFVKMIKSLGFVNEIFIANTINFDYNNKTNLLSEKKYKKWYNKKAIPLLLKEGFTVEEPFKSYYCKGYEKYSIKIYSNGNISMCNAFDYNNSFKSLKKVLDHYDRTNKIELPFENERKCESRITNNCINCKDIFLCNGEYYCRKENYCNYSDYDIKQFLRNKLIDTENKKF